MARRYDLDIQLEHSPVKGYREVIKQREWIRGYPVEFVLHVTNGSPGEFPGAGVSANITEHGPYAGLQPLKWSIRTKVEIPRLEVGGVAQVGGFGFIPLVEGICEVTLILDEPKDSEVWITGWRQPEPRRKEIHALYMVVGWQELEMIRLLRKLVKGGKS